MATQFPAHIDDDTSLPRSTDNVTGVKAKDVNQLQEAIIAIEAELGTKPSGSYGTVRNRFDSLDAIIAALYLAIGSIPPGGGGDPDPGGGGTVTTVDMAPIELIFSAGSFGTGLTSYQRVSGRSINMTRYPLTLNEKTRSVIFEAEVQKTGGATSVDIQMTDITNSVIVAGTTLTSANSSLTKLASAALTVGTASGNLQSTAETVYEVKIKMTGGTVSDQVYCTNARLLITYT